VLCGSGRGSGSGSGVRNAVGDEVVEVEAVLHQKCEAGGRGFEIVLETFARRTD
jgi:hypothetical protein